MRQVRIRFINLVVLLAITVLRSLAGKLLHHLGITIGQALVIQTRHIRTPVVDRIRAGFDAIPMVAKVEDRLAT